MAPRKNRRERTPKDIAEDIRSWAESAVFDAASGLDCMGELEGYDCADRVGAAADDMYDDAGAMEDLIGDRLYDECKDKELRNQVVDELAKMMHHLPENMWDNLRR